MTLDSIRNSCDVLIIPLKEHTIPPPFRILLATLKSKCSSPTLCQITLLYRDRQHHLDNDIYPCHHDHDHLKGCRSSPPLRSFTTSCFFLDPCCLSRKVIVITIVIVIFVGSVYDSTSSSISRSKYTGCGSTHRAAYSWSSPS